MTGIDWRGFPRTSSVFLTAAAALLTLGLAACVGGRPGHTDSASLPGPGITIYAAGDIADCKKVPPEHSGAAKTAKLIEAGLAKDRDAAVLSLGDHTYPVGLAAEFEDCYEPTWGRFKSRTYPTPGNHEYYTPQAVGYYDYFGDRAGPDRRGYYSFNLGSWHIVSLNSNLKPQANAAQLAWLKADLEQNRTQCTLAFWHHPVFSSGGHGSNPNMAEAWKLLQAAGVEVVLAAHDHDYERFALQDGGGRRDDEHGMRQFVVGTGGAQLTPFRFPKSNSEAAHNFTHGVLKMVLKEKGYEWEFLPVNENAFADRGATLCH
ncbi:metallophosphoesterase family protein [Noviherbaspirillum massiliense]|uniref:metallophosphoesterase family protein n=1 Tax=Noviherbaspirillum massiliense TaxID=1465823 RepID=UPI0002F1424E|nr:metallophosphoesterase [Noviherbaspirillum massiliense]